MFKKEYLKDLTVLFVEDEDLAREKLTKILEKVFNKVIIAANGKEGLNAFLNNKIDLIISDINMPIMNGLEMLEIIREKSYDTPIIYTTARSESENILKAVDLNVSHYIIKPIDSENLIDKIHQTCENQYIKEQLRQKEEELKKYLEAVDSVAVIYKTSRDGKITFANNKLVESSGYSLEEIKQITFYDLIHPDIPKDSVDRSWSKIKEGELWSGNTKFISKSNEAFYLKNTVFQIITNNKEEYITIGFLTTIENIEKREFKKKVIKAIQDFNKKEHTYKKIIIEQNDRLKYLENYLPRLQEQVEEEKAKTQARQRQLDHYELQMHNVDEKLHSQLSNRTKELEESTRTINLLKQDKITLANKINDQKIEIDATKKELRLLMETGEQKNKKIADLNDVIKSLETKIKDMLEEAKENSSQTTT